MERVRTLIEKLNQQKEQNCTPSQLLLTVQLLQTELMRLHSDRGRLGSAKVAVTMPMNLNFAEEELRSPMAEKELYVLKEDETELQPATSNQQQAPSTQQPATINQQQATSTQQPIQEYFLRRPATTEEPAPKKQEVSPKKEEPVIKKEETRPVQHTLHPSFDVPVEAPTLAQHQPRKELHEMLGDNKESLNDLLKEEKKEVVHVLKESPIKDLRKGIGINDRFTFINELFRGDEAMYERSIKTINDFNVLSEAEYWMNRELKFKLGWNDNKEIVQHFYHLVRRRFL